MIVDMWRLRRALTEVLDDSSTHAITYSHSLKDIMQSCHAPLPHESADPLPRGRDAAEPGCWVRRSIMAR